MLTKSKIIIKSKLTYWVRLAFIIWKKIGNSYYKGYNAQKICTIIKYTKLIKWEVSYEKNTRSKKHMQNISSQKW